MKRVNWGRLIFVTVLLVLFLFPTRTFGWRPERKITHGIILQAFGWHCREWVPHKWYSVIGNKARDIADLGVTMVWFPPVCRSVSPQGYLPGDYYDVGEPGNPTFYGDRQQLVEAINQLRNYDIGSIADIVINHRCASHQDEYGNWNIYHFPSGKARWEQWALCRGDFGGTGNDDTGEDYAAAPDIDHTNSIVQRDIIDWMKWLKDLGFAGWRYDFVKGYHARYVKLYDRCTHPAFSVGELWTDMAYDMFDLQPNQDAHRKVLCDWLDQAGDIACAFDFTTKGILQVAVMGEYWRLRDSEGKASGLIGWWPERAVTFIDNHDTGSQQGHWPFPAEKVMQGYAYILTHPGIPCLFWEHVYDWNLRGPIKQLVDIRKKFGINNGSNLVIEKAEHGLYSAFIDGRVAMKIGWRDWNPGESFEVLARGDQYTVWGKVNKNR